MSDLRVAAFQKGDHVCFFYRDPVDQIATAAEFVQTGLRQGERCLCVLPHGQSRQLVTALERLGVTTQDELSRGSLLLATPEEAYLSAGRFDRHIMVRFLERAMREAVSLGFTGFRGTGDLSWVARDTEACAQMPEYEAMLDRFYPGTASLGICMYNATWFPEGSLERIQRAHRLALMEPDPRKRAIRVRGRQAFGDVTFDRRSPELFHYTVQREGAEECLYAGQEATLSSAMEAVKSALHTLEA